jgi:hypothetical protein
MLTPGAVEFIVPAVALKGIVDLEGWPKLL